MVGAHPFGGFNMSGTDSEGGRAGLSVSVYAGKERGRKTLGACGAAMALQCGRTGTQAQSTCSAGRGTCGCAQRLSGSACMGMMRCWEKPRKRCLPVMTLSLRRVMLMVCWRDSYADASARKRRNALRLNLRIKPELRGVIDRAAAATGQESHRFCARTRPGTRPRMRSWIGPFLE